MNDLAGREAAVEEYRRKGYTVFRQVIDAKLIAEAQQHVEWLQRRHPTLRPEHFHHPLMRDDAFWVRLVTDDRLLDIAERFLGPNLACFTAHYICKPPTDGQAVLWHQDGAYWNLSPMEAVTLWVAIDDCDPDNGCLRMIPGTHCNDIGDVIVRQDIPNMLSSSIDPRLVDEEHAVDVTLKAGDVSVHHPLIIHGSEANRSPRRRCGLDIGYIRTSTALGQTGLYLNPILVRGQPVAGVNRYRAWPPYDPDLTIAFFGCTGWTDCAREWNQSAGIVKSQSGQANVRELTEQMIARLKAGTTKVVTASHDE